jgi:PmbA protein
MIEQLLELARRRSEGADAIWRRTDRTGLEFESGRLKAASVTEESGAGLRVVRRGRVGIAGSTAADPHALIERALASAELGEEVGLAFPAASQPPGVTTYDRPAADASLDTLTAIGRDIVARLAREGCQVNVSIERATGETAVANTAGALVRYPETAVAVGADIRRIAGDDVLMVYDQFAATGLPTPADIDALVASIVARLDHALTIVAPPAGTLPVVFTPSGLAAMLLPLEQALSGKAVLQGVSPLANRRDEQVFDPAFNLIDDPLLPGRPGSRPVDDEAVPSQRLPLIEKGQVQRFIYDLETAARAGVQSTGHGRRGIFGKPHAAYSNLVVAHSARTTPHSPLPATAEGVGSGTIGGGLSVGIRDGLIVDDLIGVGQGNVMGGAFSHPVALAYRVQNGAITGRVKDAAVAGNVYELLKTIGGWGNDGRWLGSRWSPSLLLEGVSVASR